MPLNFAANQGGNKHKGKMKKSKYLKSGEVGHVWAHQAAPSGGVRAAELGGAWGGRNVHKGVRNRFDGGAFYSYNTVIANIITHKGRRAFVLDVASFSNTTSKHQAEARQAIPDGEQVFRVNCGSYNQRLDFTPATLRDHYLSEYRQNYTPSRVKAKAAEQFLNQVAKLDQAIEVCEFFGLAVARLQKERTKLDLDVNPAAKLVEDHRQTLKDRRDKKWANRSAQQKANEDARIVSKITLAEGDITRLEDLEFGHGWTGAGATNWGNDDHDLDSRPELKRKVRAERKRREALTVADWVAGVAHAPRPDGPCVLRVSDGEVETSKGARVPLADAERAFRFAIARKSKGWHRNGETHKVGHYQLDAVNGDGIVAGCHRITWDELERFAKVQGWVS